MQEALRGGVGRSVANLLPRISGEVEVHLLSDSRWPPVASRLPQRALRTPVPGVSASWLQLSAARWLRDFDGVFHCPYYALPFALSVPGVVTLHDITFEHFPSWFSRRQGLSFRLQARRAAKTAAVILTPTEFIKQDLVQTYHVDPARILVAAQGVDPVFRSDLDFAEILTELAIRRPYVVALGGAPRRNLSLAIAAWRPLGNEVELVVVGGQEPPSERGLTWVGPVNDASFAGLLCGAAAFVYPTAYEGFGMPGLEALGAGTPVVAARMGSLPEVLGDAAAWADSLEVPDLTAALTSLLSDPVRADSLRTRGLQRAASRPGWDEAAGVHLQAYAMAAATRT